MKALFPACLLVTTVFVSGQTAHAQMEAGLRLGANASTVSGDQVSKSSAGYSYQVGMFMRFTVAGLRVQPELLFTSRKYDFTQQLGEVGAFTYSEKKIKSTYFDLPLYLNIDLVKNLHLLAGPVFSMRMAGEQELKDGADSDGHDFELFDVGISGGLGYTFKSGIDVSARGQLGFIPLYAKINENLTGPNEPDIKNRSFQLTVGLPIGTSGEEAKVKTYKESY